MKNEFLKQLDNDEELIFYGYMKPGKSSNQLGRFIIGFLAIVLFWIIIIYCVKNNAINITIIMIIVTLSVISILMIYSLIYNLILKYKHENKEYFVSNKKVAIYNKKIGFIVKNISDIERISVMREKDGYGDLGFISNVNDMINSLKNGLEFLGVENPYDIANKIKEINNNIYIYNDKPTIMEKEIK